MPLGLLLLSVPALAQAEEIKAKIKSVDAEKSMITVTAGEGERTLEVSKDVKVTHRVCKNEKKAKTGDLPGPGRPACFQNPPVGINAIPGPVTG
jgi:hypothetical protein